MKFVRKHKKASIIVLIVLFILSSEIDNEILAPVNKIFPPTLIYFE